MEVEDVLGTISQELQEGQAQTKSLPSVVHDLLELSSHTTRETVRVSEIVAVGTPDTFRLKVKGSEPRPISYWGFSQLCKYAKVPTKFAKDLIRNESLPLLADIFNTLLHKVGVYDKEVQVVTVYNRIAGVVSSKYEPLPSAVILKALSTELGDHWEVSGLLATQEMLNVRLLHPSRIRISDGKVQYGVVFRNSEVGRSTLTIDAILYDPDSKTTLLFNEKASKIVRKRHTVKEGFDFTTYLEDVKEKVSDLKPKVEALISLADTMGRTEISAEPVTDINKGKKIVNRQPPRIVQDLLRDNVEKFGFTVYGLSLSMANIGKRYSIDRREELELLGGKILTEYYE